MSMKRLDFKRVDLSDLSLPDGAKPYDLIFQQIETAVVSNFSGQQITLQQQREINEVLGHLDAHQDGIVELPESRWAALLGWWNKRKLPAQAGGMRKLYHRIDLLLTNGD